MGFGFVDRIHIFLGEWAAHEQPTPSQPLVVFILLYLELCKKSKISKACYILNF